MAFVACEIVRVQTALVPHDDASPAQVVKRDVLSGAAVSVMVVPSATIEEQAGPQLMPDGDDITVPLPAPCLVTWTLKAATQTEPRLSPASADQDRKSTRLNSSH